MEEIIKRDYHYAWIALVLSLFFWIPLLNIVFFLPSAIYLSTKQIRLAKREPEKEIIQKIVDDFAEKIRIKREKLGLKQEDFAKSISEKESVIHKLETGEFHPSLELAEKLEKILKIKLIEEYEEEYQPQTKTDLTTTIGDLVQIRKRSKQTFQKI